jgi:hypothetical protein
MPTPRSFLLTVHEPGSAVLQDLSTGRSVHVTDLGTLGPTVAHWMEARSDRRAGEDALLQRDRRARRLDPELVDEGPAAGQELS